MCLESVPEFDNQRMPLEHLLHDAALDAFAAAVNQAHLTEAELVRGVDVLLDDRRDVTRREGMQVDMVFDGKAVRHRRALTSAADTTP